MYFQIMKMKLSIAFAFMLLASLAVPPAVATQTTYSFYAEHTGWFAPFGGFGVSPLFGVAEGGTGLVAGDSESFEYTTSLIHRTVRVASDLPGCASISSFAVDGSGVLVFDAGEIMMKRISGTSCVQFPVNAPPIIIIEEEWRITSGTGKYRGASGKLNRWFVGSLVTYDGSGTFEGTIKLVE